MVTLCLIISSASAALCVIHIMAGAYRNSVVWALASAMWLFNAWRLENSENKDE